MVWIVQELNGWAQGRCRNNHRLIRVVIMDARVNLSTKRLVVRWRDGVAPPPVLSVLARLGYRAHLEDHEEVGEDRVFAALVKALAVAGFAAGNVMLLSVSVWAGVDGPTRDLFHWLSATIAFPAVAYSGRVFFLSAWNVVRHGRANMDVPISVGVILACGLSLYDTIHAREHAYFDAAIMLLFFLLIGRTLDHMMREKARGGVRGLTRLVPRTARVPKSILFEVRRGTRTLGTTFGRLRSRRPCRVALPGSVPRPY
jgi:P-type Cu2+ transporter